MLVDEVMNWAVAGKVRLYWIFFMIRGKLDLYVNKWVGKF